MASVRDCGIEDEPVQAPVAELPRPVRPDGAVLIAGGTLSEVTAQVVRAVGDRGRPDATTPHRWLLVPLEPGADCRLTSRESQVLQMIREGMTNKEIARTLDVAVHTANRHVSNILRKLHARNRAEAVHRFQAGPW